MKKLYFLLFFVFSFLAKAQIVNIPDANFKAKLLSANPSNSIASTEMSIYNAPSLNWIVSNYHTIDTNGDGEIQVVEAEAIKYLSLQYSTISDLTGIEAFVNLQTLYCHNNQLTSLDITQNTQLRVLHCFNNQLTSLDFTQNPEFLDLNCYGNQLTSLDFTQNPQLKYLTCFMNQLAFLDVTQNSQLQRITCNNNQLTSLDVTQNPQLQHLECNNNQLTSLDVTQNPQLQKLYCFINQLISLDLTQNTQLFLLVCYTNNLITLNLKNNNNNVWSTLNFGNNSNLQYICADEEDVAYVQNKINGYGYASTCHVNSYCSFNPGGTFYEISGNTKFDLNNNGCDANDINYPNLKFNITDGTNTGIFITNNTGDYYIPVSAGSHTVIPVLENPSYFNISPTSFTVNFPTQASPIVQDFCVSIIPHSDVEIIIMPITPARPGFDANYKIIYRNKGNQVENGNVSLTFDDAVLDYVSSNPVYNSATPNAFYWNYTNLQPFETREIEITFNVNSPMESPAVNNGNILNYTATITTANTDETPDDNTFTLNQTVVGSYDPNDKTCLEGEYVSSSTVGKYVHYVIRFENTGTYLAENIVVKDMIDISKFDVSTLVPLHGSHEFFTRINGNKVEFILENINLDFDDVTNDGYVAFKIKTKSNLTVGQTFSNNASIYFDYNFPIVTNTYTTTINNVLNNQDFAFENEFLLYPNPAKDILNISTKNQTEIQSVEIYNLIGQVVIAIPNSTNKIDVSSLEAGTYFMKVNTKKGSSTTKFVKE